MKAYLLFVAMPERRPQVVESLVVEVDVTE